ncbi:hypothetical protein PR048_018360 [Dryococelus australis]|uniref:Uncharacterized protein n=1 Tax=Dryococelus australis TaxID=614101 RepID=A0ABQ9HC95_9NEOP|nr:hypothetical protein PR048_018360 [Dryococelus australis]
MMTISAGKTTTLLHKTYSTTLKRTPYLAVDRRHKRPLEEAVLDAVAHAGNGHQVDPCLPQTQRGSRFITTRRYTSGHHLCEAGGFLSRRHQRWCRLECRREVLQSSELLTWTIERL